MSHPMMFALLLGSAFVVSALGSPAKHHYNTSAAKPKANRHDPAFRTGYMDGYHQGSNDSEALSNSYKDESGPRYDQALDGYTPTVR